MLKWKYYKAVAKMFQFLVAFVDRAIEYWEHALFTWTPRGTQASFSAVSFLNMALKNC